MKRFFFIGVLMALLSLGIEAQNVSMKLDSTRYLIGDWINVHLEFEYPKNHELVLPDIYNTWKEFEIVSISEIDTLIKGTSQSLKYDVVISKYDTGFFPLPPLSFFILSDDGLDSFYTEALLIEIMGVAIDTSSLDPKEIKDILPEKITFKEIFKRFFWIPLVLLLLALLIWLYKRRKPKEKVIEDIKEKIPPHIIALERLAELSEKKLWQKGDAKAYYIELSDIVRAYIEDRFNSPALESTSDEIISNLSRKSISREMIEELSFMLKTADLAKFAKFNPLSEENEQCYKIAKDFVINTKQEENEEQDA